MRQALFVTLTAGIAALAIACSGGATVTLAPGQTLPAGSTLPPAVVTPAPVVPVGNACAGLPTFNPDAPLASFPPDAGLNARFPTQIDGQPVTGITSSFWLYSLCYYGADAESIARFTALFPGSTASQIATGYARVELDDDSITISAFRIPGGDPNQIFSHIPEFYAALGGDPEDAANTTVTTANIGGKNAYVTTDSDGSVSYHFVSGDTVFSLSDVTQEQAATIFAGIQ